MLIILMFIAIAYIVYFIFAGWIFLLKKRSRFVKYWCRSMYISIFVVGQICAYYDLEIAKSGFNGFNFFVMYLIFTILFSWGVLALDGTEEKKQ